MIDSGDNSRPDRRAFLGLLATTSLAGCGGQFGGLFSEEPTRLDADELAAIASGDFPNVPARLPVQIRRSHVDASEDRVRELLERVRDPLGPAEIPNEAVRRNLRDTRDRANYYLDEAATRESRYETLIELRTARRYAFNVAAAWQTIDEGQGSVDVEAEAAEIDEALTSFRDEWEYLGDDPTTALVVHEALESISATAGRGLQNSLEDAEHGLESAPAVGEAVESMEHARATVEDASHVFEQYENSLETPQSVRDQFEVAGSSLADEVEDRLDPLPTFKPGEESKFVERDVSGEPAEHLLEDAVREIDWRSQNIREGDSNGPADAIRSAHTTLAYIMALEPIRERIDDGERFKVESVQDVRRWREKAIEAVSALADEAENELLNRTVSSQLAENIRVVDRNFADERGPVYASSASNDAVDYLWIAAVADATPAASRAVVDALRAAADS